MQVPKGIKQDSKLGAPKNKSAGARARAHSQTHKKTLILNVGTPLTAPLTGLHHSHTRSSLSIYVELRNVDAETECAVAAIRRSTQSLKASLLVGRD